MQGIEIVHRLKDVLGKYNNDFGGYFNVTRLSKLGSVVTATSDIPHGLNTNDYVTIKGSKEPISINSLTRVDNVVNAVTLTDHKLIDPSRYTEKLRPIYIEIVDAVPADYNGVFELISVSDQNNFSFKINTTPSSPAANAGTLLQEDFNGYNGYKQITKIDDYNFTYNSTIYLGTPAQGMIQGINTYRIAFAGTPEEINQFYDENSNNILETWLFVLLGSKSIYKNNTVASDISSAMNSNESYFYESQQDFSLFVIIPKKNQVLSGIASDKARSYELPILKALANYNISSSLYEQQYQPITYVGNEPDESLKAFYIHRFDFLAKGFIRNEDTFDHSKGSPFRLLNDENIDKDIECHVNLR